MTDLVVAGTMGAWTALQAMQSGRKTMLIDAYGAGHPRATSGDETRILRASHGPDAYYARWAREARDAWIGLSEIAGRRLFPRLPASPSSVMPGFPSSA